MLEKQILRKIEYLRKCPSYPLPFYGTQITFLSSIISANHDKVGVILTNPEILIPLVVFNCSISFIVAIELGYKEIYMALPI